MFLVKAPTKLQLTIIVLVDFLVRESGGNASRLSGFKRLRRFDGMSIVNDLLLLHQFEVHNSKVECGMKCVSHITCSTFVFNELTFNCQLFPPLVYDDDVFKKETSKRKPGVTYYSLGSTKLSTSGTEDWCPVTKGFMLDRETGLCFYVSEVKKTWQESVTACKDIGARLMIIDDVDRQRKMTKILNDDFNVTKEAIWIGGRDYYAEDNRYNFHWVNGSKVVNFFWGLSQPDGLRYSEYCLGIKYAMLHDCNCDYPYRFICDIPY